MNDLPGDALARAVAELRGEGCSVEAVPGDLSASASARQVASSALQLLAGLTRELARGLAPDVPVTRISGLVVPRILRRSALVRRQASDQ